MSQAALSKSQVICFLDGSPRLSVPFGSKTWRSSESELLVELFEDELDDDEEEEEELSLRFFFFDFLLAFFLALSVGTLLLFSLL